MDSQDKIVAFSFITVVTLILLGCLYNQNQEREFKLEAIHALKDNVSVHLDTKDLKGLLE